MRIKAPTSYLSIGPFTEVDLPDLTVLVGLNGSGKSHLLQGLKAGLILTDLFQPIGHGLPQLSAELSGQNAQQSFLLLQNGDPMPPLFAEEVPSRIAGTPATGSNYSWDSGHDPMVIGFDQIRDQNLAPHQHRIEQALGEQARLVLLPGEDLWRVGDTELIRRSHAAGSTVDPQAVAAIFNELRATLRQPAFQFWFGKADLVGRKLGIDPLAVTGEQVKRHSPWGYISPFEPPVGQLIARYRDIQVRNGLQHWRDQQEGTALALLPSQFEAEHGRPPWVVISETLEAFGLPYRVAAPATDPAIPTRFALRRVDSSAEVQVAALSSGERVLLRFALSLFNYDVFNLATNLPKLVLFDEMDASLHPEMVQRWLTALEEGLVGSLGTKVILTTHSPTTVALAPEASLFEMRRGIPGPRKVSKQQALNGLTFGVPTLSVDFSGRRQVFVESDTDAATFEVLATIMKSRVAMPRSLAFISTGIREKNVEQNTGCQIVRQIVGQLRDNGARTVSGVLDWDGGRNQSKPGIRVLAEGTHYALDNLLLDPLLLAILLLRENKAPATVEHAFGHVGALNAGELQKLADAVVASVPLPNTADQSRVESYFAGGLTILIPREWQVMRGHDLEDLIVEHHKILKKWLGKGRGKLTEAIASLVIRDYPDLCPKPLADLLVDLSGDDLRTAC